MRSLVYLLFLFVAVLSGCKGGLGHGRLVQVDTLLRSGRLVAADSSLQRIDTAALDGADRAYFGLLRTATDYRLYREIRSDSLIKSSVGFYRESGDHGKLGESYFYQGMILYSLGKVDDAIVCLKQAEEQASMSRDVALEHKVYNGLVTVNYATDNHDLALKYAKKELECSRRSRNKDWMAYAYNHLSCVYDKKGLHDSALFYISKVIPYIRYVSKWSQAYHLSNIGLYYLHRGDTLKAKDFLRRSYDATPLPDTSNMLARLLFAEGRQQEAMRLLHDVLGKCDLEGQVKVREAMAELLYSVGRYKESGLAATEAATLKDSLEATRQRSKVQALQLEYDRKVAEEGKDDIIICTTAIFVTVLAAIFCAVLYYRRNANRAGYSIRLLSDKYKRKIAELEASGRDRTAEIEELKRQLADATTQKTDDLACGRVLYESIKAGETVAKWTKADFECFIGYYKLVNPGVFDMFERCYDGLSHVNMFFLILQDMGCGNDEIRRILGFSQGAMRAARFRIKAKMKV